MVSVYQLTIYYIFVLLNLMSCACKKKQKTVIISSPPCWSQARQSFVVQKTFQQPHSKTVLQQSPQITEVTEDKKLSKKDKMVPYNSSSILQVFRSPT